MPSASCWPLLQAQRLARDVAAHAKKNLHPKWYRNAKVICNGEVVMTVCGTQPEYQGVWGVER